MGKRAEFPGDLRGEAGGLRTVPRTSPLKITERDTIEPFWSDGCLALLEYKSLACGGDALNIKRYGEHLGCRLHH